MSRCALTNVNGFIQKFKFLLHGKILLYKELSKRWIPVILMTFTLVLFHFGEISICDSSMGSWEGELATVFSDVLYLTKSVYSKKE